jgi:pimeloyl-ACP methyl ester carboxylesterase
MSVDVKRSPEQFANVGGVTLCWQSFGEESAPAIVLIMGLGVQMILWDDTFCAQVAARGFRVVRFDNRDIGRSSWLDAPVRETFGDLIQKQLMGQKIAAPYALKDMAADVVGLFDHLAIARAHVVGASMGGMIGQELAIHFPHRLHTLTSIMSSTGNPMLPPPSPEATAVLLAPPPRTRDEYVASFLKTWRVLRAGDFPDEERKDISRAEETFARGLNPMGVMRQMMAIFASGDRRPKLAHVRTPTLVVHGDVDPLVRLAGGHDTAKSIPGARLLVVEGMGHALPAVVWPGVIDAIAGHASAHPA